MRNAGDRVSGGSASRRQRGALPQAPPRPGGNGGASLFTPAYRISHGADPAGAASGGASAARGAPGYAPAGAGQSAYSPAGEPPDAAWVDGDEPAPRYPWEQDEDDEQDPWSAQGLPGYLSPPKASNAIRGFPPKPDDPLPVYPPGPFAAWNRSTGEGGQPAVRGTARREDQSVQLAAASITPVEFDTDYSLPAIKDPVAPAAGQGGGRHGQGRPEQAPSQRPGRDGRRAPASHVAKRSGGAGHHQSVRLAIGAAALVVVVVAVVLVVTSLGSGSTSAQGPTPRHQSSSPSHSPAGPPGPWKYIGSRATDLTPLALAELYPASFTAQTVFYRRVAQAKGKLCHAALIGSALQTAVRKAGCTQVLRASYVARGTKMMGTIGVFNLKTATAANTAALATGHSEFVAQLPGKKGAARKLGQGTGVEEAFVKGHYLVLCWAEFTGLTTPKTSAQRLQLTAFMNELIKSTANISLSDRMVTGKPAPAPTPTG